jgi:hypothetical protein
MSFFYWRNSVQDDLLIILDELKKNGISKCNPEIKKITSRLSLDYVDYYRRFNIYIYDTDCNDNLFKFTIYKNKFIYGKYYNIRGFMCDRKEEAVLRIGMSEEEYFQESTITNLLELEFSEYCLILDMISIISDALDEE